MFDYIKGVFISERETPEGVFMTVECAGIGYSLRTVNRVLRQKKDEERITVYVSLLHREDTMALFGFFKREERDIFNILQTVSGVGAKAALALINEFTVEELMDIMMRQDFKALSGAKGIGEKSAKKIILELHDKLAKRKDLLSSDYSEKTPDIPFKNCDEALSVLLSLGYSKNEVAEAFSAINKSLTTNEEILHDALKYLAQK